MKGFCGCVFVSAAAFQRGVLARGDRVRRWMMMGVGLLCGGVWVLVSKLERVERGCCSHLQPKFGTNIKKAFESSSMLFLLVCDM